MVQLRMVCGHAITADIKWRMSYIRNLCSTLIQVTLCTRNTVHFKTATRNALMFETVKTGNPKCIRNCWRAACGKRRNVAAF
jgi:hypothetical protein